jgi:hypothetical protein
MGYGTMACMDTTAVMSLVGFRSAQHTLCGRRRDALFDLCDALLTAGPVPSPAHLSLQPQHRRGWGSLYDALAIGAISGAEVEALLAAHPLAGGEPIYAVDASVWARCDAETSPGRAVYYHPSRHSAGKPVVAGWAYQWIAQLGFAPTSWTAPVSVRRLQPQENPNRVAVQQIRDFLRRLPVAGALPWFVFDAGYDSVQLAQALAGARAALLVRLRAGRSFYADPTSQPPTGRPRRHGHKFDCTDPTTWPPPTAQLRKVDAQYGTVWVRAWTGLHPKTQEHGTRGTRKPRPLVRGTLILVEVARLPQPTQPPKPLWLWWQAPDGAADSVPDETPDEAHSPVPDLDRVWRAYVRRFDLEHTFRFLKQTLNWTLPRVRHPEQADRWTWLVVLAYTQLRLARPLVADSRLPWERPLTLQHLTPSRVRRGFWRLLLTLGSPAKPPKPCGRSPGRPKGKRSGRAVRYPAMTKAIRNAAQRT